MKSDSCNVSLLGVSGSAGPCQGGVAGAGPQGRLQLKGQRYCGKLVQGEGGQVGGPEQTSRHLLNFLNLPWTEAISN